SPILSPGRGHAVHPVHKRVGTERCGERLRAQARAGTIGPGARRGRAMSDDGAQRLRRPSWRDARLGVGVLLVSPSVARASWAVATSDRTTDVLLAVEALTPGDRLADADLRPHAVRPDGLADAYVVAGEELPEDAVVTRVVGAGELVPAAA